MIKSLQIVCLFLIPLFSLGQDWNYYTPIAAKGEVPADFTEAYSTKFKREKSKISKVSSQKNQELTETFHQRSEYFIDEYLTNGKVFFGDTITNYCQSVLDKLIGDDPELRNSIRIYTVKTPIVNAAATANGIIFVNLGLIAQMETEAQLAYILAHELVHYTNDHVLDQFIEEDKILKGEDLYRNTSEDEKLAQLSTHSKSHELEADEEGFEKYFAKSGYNSSAPFEVLDILQYAYLPVDEVPFNTNMFESGSYKIPSSYQLEEVASIKAEDDYDDENSSHPNLLKRRKKLGRIIDKKEGANYIVSESLFKHCRKMARFELSRLHLVNRDYVESIYNSFLLLREDSANRYLRLSVAKALHGLTVYESESDLYDVMLNYEDIEGESQQLYYLFDQLGEGELSILNLNYTYRLKRDYPEDEAIDRLYKRALELLVLENEWVLDDFYQISLDSLKSQASTQKDSLDGLHRANSKVGRIKSKELNYEAGNVDTYWKYALVEFMEDDEFIDDMEEMEEEFEDSKKDDSSEKKRSTTSNSRFDDNVALGIDKAMVLTPKYLNLDQREETGIKFFSSERNKEQYKGMLRQCANIVGLELEFFDYKRMRNLDAETFNQMAILKSWTTERMNHVNHPVLVSDFDNIQEAIDLMDSPYLINTGHLSLREKEADIGMKICGGILLPPLLPFIIYDLASPDYSSFSYFFLFDLNTGNALMAEYNSYDNRDNSDYVKSIVYNYMLQVASKSKN
tara:strand:- start:136482 stop:138701 length:2220 start_codon:yes stop_codon:yes gene_type:complete